MLDLKVQADEGWDPIKEEFIEGRTFHIRLEHSLLSISKWESKWKKPFLTKEPKSREEFLDYVRCMTITQNVDPNIYQLLTPYDIASIRQYMEDPFCATKVNHMEPSHGKPETITAEVIYYWMTVNQIPFECEKWHLNKLMTLIDLCNVKNNPGKKMPQSEVYKQQAALNKARRKAHR